MTENSKSRIGLCVVCSPAFLEGRLPLGERGYFITNTGNKPSEYVPEPCSACKGKGYTYFRSDK